MSNNGTLVRNLIRGGSGGGGSATEVALLSVTTAPSGSFAVGSKYYDLATKKIVTAVTANTWVGATSADPEFNVIYTFNSLYYAWDGNSLEQTDLNLYATKVELASGLAGKIDKYLILPTATIDYVGIIAQYVGPTGDGGTNGYFYKGISTSVDSEITAGIGTSTGITEASVVKATFEGEITETGTYNFIYNASTATADIGLSTGITGASVVVATFETLLNTTGDYVFTFDGTDWTYNGSAVTLADYGISVTGTPNENDTVTVSYVEADWKYDGDIVTLSDYGISVVGTPDDLDVVVIEYTASSFAYSWELINVQPATVVPDASNTVKGIIRIATDGEATTGTSEVLAVNPKQLAQIAECPSTVLIDFELQSNVLSSSAKRVVKSGTFFVFENGDVSVDGKTIIKENAVDGSVLDLYGDDNYVIFMYQTSVKVYTIGEDGTITLARTFTISGTNTIFEGKISNANNNYCFPGRADNTRGFYYIPLVDLLDEEVLLTHIVTTGGNADYVAKVIFWLNNYVVFHNATYDTQYKTMFYGTDIATVFSAGTQILLTVNNVIKTAEVIDNKLVIVASSGAFGALTELPTEHNSIGILNLVCPCTADIIKTIGDVIYFCDSTNGQYATTEDITQAPVLARNVGYDIEVIGTNKLITLNSTDIFWSGETAITADMLEKTTETLFTQKSDNTITGNNINTEFSIIGAGVGSLTLPKYLLSVGKKLRITGWGILSGVNGTATTLKIKLGTTEIISSTDNLPTALTDVKFDIEANITVREIGATGTVICGGTTTIHSAVGFGTSTTRNFFTASPIEIDTTAEQILSATYQFGTASTDNNLVLKDLSVVSYN